MLALDFGAQLGIVGELSVKGEGEPFSPFDVGAFEGLRVVGIFLAACRVADMADGGGSGVLLHEVVVGPLLVEVEDLGDGTDIFVGLNQRATFRSVGAESRGQLSPVLNVQKHSGEEAGDLSWPLGWAQGARFGGVEMIDRGDAALVMKFRHAWGEPMRGVRSGEDGKGVSAERPSHSFHGSLS